MVPKGWAIKPVGELFDVQHKAKLNNLKVSLPNLEEQRKIADILSIADAEVEVFENKLKILKQEKKH